MPEKERFIMQKRSVIAVVSLLLLAAGCSREKPAVQSPPKAKSFAGARVFIIEPADSQTVTNPVTVKFGIEGADLAPAGPVKDNSGHHHLLIDLETLPPMDEPLPFNEHVMHFGQAQKEATITLSPGSHTLQLILAGGNHVPLDPPVVSEKVRINVK